MPSAPYKDLPLVKIDTLIGQEIVLDEFTPLEGKFGKYIAVKAHTTDGQLFTFNTGGQVIVKKLQICLEKRSFPVLGVITKDAHYYDIQ